MATKKRTSNNDSFGGKTSLSSSKPVDKSNSLPATMGKRVKASRAEVKSAVTGAKKIAGVNRTKSAQAQAANAAKPNKITRNTPPTPRRNADSYPSPRAPRNAPRYPRPGGGSQAKLPRAL